MCNPQPGLRCSTHAPSNYFKAAEKVAQLEAAPNARKAGEYEKAVSSLKQKEKDFDLLAIKDGVMYKVALDNYNERIAKGANTKLLLRKFLNISTPQDEKDLALSIPTKGELEGLELKQQIVDRYLKLTQPNKDDTPEQAKSRADRLEALREETGKAYNAGLFMRSISAASIEVEKESARLVAGGKEPKPSFQHILGEAVTKVLTKLRSIPLAERTDTVGELAQSLQAETGHQVRLPADNRWDTLDNTLGYIQDYNSSTGKPTSVVETMLRDYAHENLVRDPKPVKTTIAEMEAHQQQVIDAEVAKWESKANGSRFRRATFPVRQPSRSMPQYIPPRIPAGLVAGSPVRQSSRSMPQYVPPRLPAPPAGPLWKTIDASIRPIVSNPVPMEPVKPVKPAYKRPVDGRRLLEL